MVRSDRGAALVWAVALMSAIFLAAAVGTALGAVVVGRQRAAISADLAALGAARSLDCSVASSTAIANGSRLTGCSWEGGDVVVQVARPLPAIARLLHRDEVSAVARAGPSSVPE